ncbi:uncharacterized protein N7483_000437 [Penicillium malachiteum]|uniref:uncharacterized protein n=1 Tax=Penicillium malachiteum TaxID=1324776 RepID=UPI002547D14B|nr:uncharacterized protein N7483_000437 [Penicillium malachiteum]KAJ5735312.1 hypothetical protein N7483_000437 [Penicillium malachiteum]
MLNHTRTIHWHLRPIIREYTGNSLPSQPRRINLYQTLVKPVFLRREFSNASANASQRILPAIKNEHADLHSHSNKILISLNPDEQTRYQNLFTWELARHIIGEELIIYPAIARHVHGGNAISNRNRTEHQEIKEQLKMFQGLRSTDPRFAPTLEALIADLQTHTHREETEDLVSLEEVLSSEQSEALTGLLKRTRMFIPSRSHPLSPSKPPFETVVGLLTAPVDMVADLFRKWPHHGESEKSI